MTSSGVMVTRQLRCSTTTMARGFILHNIRSATTGCKRNIEMTPPCKVEVTLPRVVGSGEVHRGGGVVDEQAGVQPS